MMEEDLKVKSQFLKQIIDSFPFAVFVLDVELNVIDCNNEATDIAKVDINELKRKFCGDMLHCINSQNKKLHCGLTENCKDCVVNCSLKSALHGELVVRKRAEMSLLGGNNAQMYYFLVTTSSLPIGNRTLILLTLEDISEVIQLKGIIPICMHCKEIRDDKGYWNKVEVYITEHSEAKFSHGICPICAKKHYSNSIWRKK